MDLDDLVFVEKSERLNGCLRFQSVNKEFNKGSVRFLDKFDTLISVDKFTEFVEFTKSQGLDFHFVDDAREEFDLIEWANTSEFEVDAPFLETETLFPFQKVGMNLCLKTPSFLLEWDTGSGKCVHPDTWVRTSEGLFRIGELCPPGSGFTPNTISVETREGVELTSDTFRQPSVEGVSLTTSLGIKLRSTKRHRWLVLGENGLDWKFADEFVIGDEVLVQTRPSSSWGEYVTFEPRTWTHRDSCRCSTCRWLRRNPEYREPQILDEKLARLLGWIVAEAWMGEECISIAQHLREHGQDKSDANEDIRTLLREVFGLDYGPQKYGYSISSRANSWLYEKCKLTRSVSRDKTVPEVIFRSPRTVVCAFLRGYFEGDGEVGRGLSCSSASETLLEQIQQLLLSLGIVSTRTSFKSSAKNSRRPVTRQYWRLQVHYGQNLMRFEDQIGFISTRKRSRLAALTAGSRRKANTNTDLLPFVSVLCERVLEELLAQRLPVEKKYPGASSRNSVRSLWPQDLRDYSGWKIPRYKDRHSRDYIFKFVNSMRRYDEELKDSKAWSDLQEILRNEYTTTRIVQVEAETSDYCDFSVPGSHSYIANGVVSHNSVGAGLVAQKLIDDDIVDLCLFFVKKNKLYDWQEFLSRGTTLESEIVLGNRPYRHNLYKETKCNTLILNYEKAREGSRKTRRSQVNYSRTDLLQLLDLVEGKRVLFVLDEVQKVRTGGSVAQGLIRLIGNCQPRMIGLTATPFVTSPANLYNIYSVLHPELPHVSRDWHEFMSEYVEETRITQFGMMVTKWKNLSTLGRRVQKYSHRALKSDPLIAKQFPEKVERLVTLDLSDQDRHAYNRILRHIQSGFDDSPIQSGQENLQFMRMFCNTSEAVKISQSQFAEDIRPILPLRSLETANSAKFNVIKDMLEDLLNSGEKIVLFTKWTNFTLLPYAKLLKDLPLSLYYGEMSFEERQKSIERFNSSKDGHVLLSSDAGQDGLNIYGRYLIHIDTPMTYAEYKQRSDRIHRSDSHKYGIDGVWIYRFETVNTVESRVEQVMKRRKTQSEEISSNYDSFTEERLTKKDLSWILFGS